jgi:hypothetical protein
MTKSEKVEEAIIEAFREMGMAATDILLLPAKGFWKQKRNDVYAFEGTLTLNGRRGVLVSWWTMTELAKGKVTVKQDGTYWEVHPAVKKEVSGS